MVVPAAVSCYRLIIHILPYCSFGQAQILKMCIERTFHHPITLEGYIQLASLDSQNKVYIKFCFYRVTLDKNWIFPDLTIFMPCENYPILRLLCPPLMVDAISNNCTVSNNHCSFFAELAGGYLKLACAMMCAVS